MIRAQVVLYDGFDPLDAVAPFEVLLAGGAASSGAVEVELVSAEGPRRVVSGSGGLTLDATGALGGADVVIVPGVSGSLDQISARLGHALGTDLPAQLGAALRDPDVLVATVCGGLLVLSMAGLIEGRNAVTHHQGMGLLAAAGVTAVPARVVDDGDLVSSGAVTSGLDLGLYLVDRLLGPKIAHAVEEVLDYERRGVVWRDQGAVPVAI